MLDLRGDLILTHNEALVRGRIKSAAPASVRNATYVAGVHSMGFLGKLNATRVALGFIWARESQALTHEAIDREGL